VALARLVQVTLTTFLAIMDAEALDLAFDQVLAALPGYPDPKLARLTRKEALDLLNVSPYFVTRYISTEMEQPGAVLVNLISEGERAMSAMSQLLTHPSAASASQHGPRIWVPVHVLPKGSGVLRAQPHRPPFCTRRVARACNSGAEDGTLGVST
jgi:hypothetical protein